MYKKLKQWWDNIKTFIQKQRQLHREEVNIKDSLIASAEESKKQSVDSFLLKKEELKQIKKDVKEEKGFLDNIVCDSCMHVCSTVVF